MGGVIGIIIGVIVCIIIDIMKGHIFIAPIFITAIIVIIGFAIYDIADYFRLLNHYKKYCKEFTDTVKRNKDSSAYNNERYKYWQNEFNKFKEKKIKEFEINVNPYLREERNEVEKQLGIVENTLESLYNLRINNILCLHPNYQGMIPISIIYGYFDTGRCTQLKGHEGAYNLYEDEKMKGMIINKLDVVSRQLGQLQNSMVYVGKAIEECNSRLSDLETTSNQMISAVNNMNKNVSNQLNGVSNQMNAIEVNTANGAYYAQVGAEMTTFNTVYNLLKD